MSKVVEEISSVIKARVNMLKDFATSPVGLFETIDNRIRALRSALYRIRTEAKERVREKVGRG